jgi:dTDP-4-amino-4,6-dideoxygalactose transaminase
MILLNDFKAEYLAIKEEIDTSIQRVLNSGWYVLGKEVQKFEREFAEFLGVSYCVGVASGTDAITLSLMALEIAQGDEVITTNMTAFPTITGILRAGAKPVVVDILPDDGLIDTTQIEMKISRRTKAIIPVHLYGQSCDMTSISDIAKKYNLKIVEDCAQATGTTFKGRKTGTVGDCGAFSFYPTKNLSAYGDGGAIVTNNKAVHDRLMMMRNYGKQSTYFYSIDGFNSRLDELQAAILRVKLGFLNQWNMRRREIAAAYQNNLKTVVCLTEHEYGNSVFHLFVVKSKNRDSLLTYLEQMNVKSLIHYPVPVNRQKAFPYQKDEFFEYATSFAREILSLPVHPFLRQEDIDNITGIINDFK